MIGLGISKNDSAERRGACSRPARSLTYTVVVTNHGTGTATGVAITDPLPADYSVTAGPPRTRERVLPPALPPAAPARSIKPASPCRPAVRSPTRSMARSARRPPAVDVDQHRQRHTGRRQSRDRDRSATWSASPAVDRQERQRRRVFQSQRDRQRQSGQSLTYTVVVSNTGTGRADGATVTDPLPSGFRQRQLRHRAGGRSHRLESQRHRRHQSQRHGQPARRRLDHLHHHRHGQFGGRGHVVEHGDHHARGRQALLRATDPDNLTGLEIEKSDDAGGDSGSANPDQQPGGNDRLGLRRRCAGPTRLRSPKSGPARSRGPRSSISFPSGYSLTSWSVTATTGGSHAIQHPAAPATSADSVDPAVRRLDHVHHRRIRRDVRHIIEHGHRVRPQWARSISATDTDNVQENNEVVPVGGHIDRVRWWATAAAIAPPSSGFQRAQRRGVDALRPASDRTIRPR